MAQNLDQHFRQYQRAYANAHRSDDRPQHASHIIGVNVARQLAVSQDDPGNYRMQRPHTNQSVHERIDRRFLNGTNDGRGFSFAHPSIPGRVVFVSREQQVERLLRQTAQMARTGDIHNPTNYNFLRGNAQRLGMDQRRFNGITPRSHDITTYRNVGRPRASDRTPSGRVRRS